MGSLKSRRPVKRKTVVDFRHFSHQFSCCLFVCLLSISGNIAIAEFGHHVLVDMVILKKSYFSRRGFYKDSFSSICFDVQF